MAAVMETIQRKTPIDATSELGQKLDKVDGRLEFKNIQFKYPNRQNITVVNDLSLTVNPGETIALVGQSGCGKSTLIQLAERFYDPVEGQVCLDGVDLKELNVKWYRQQVGLVSQEPTLFSGTILENIKWGKPEATDDEVEIAAKLANAHDFILQLPLKYQTLVLLYWQLTVVYN